MVRFGAGTCLIGVDVAEGILEAYKAQVRLESQVEDYFWRLLCHPDDVLNPVDVPVPMNSQAEAFNFVR